MNSDIISLQETSANIWQAKYSGNYGTYNIKIKMDGKNLDTFSCSCPSQYYPCKHIAIIKAAIDKRISKKKEEPKENAITVEELLKKVPHQELINFIIRYAKYNPEFTNKILLEFIHKSSVKQDNSYALILHKALQKISFDYDDLYEYHDNAIEIDILDEWLAKAQEKILQKHFDEALAICKACIEEYAEWADDIDDDIIEYIDTVYQEKPFDLLKEIASSQTVYSNDLFQYCIKEMNKPKYTGSYLYDNFNDLLLELPQPQGNAAEFIAIQDKLLQNITDKSSYEAQKIFERKIAFYKKTNQPETAWQIVSENIQIENFRKQVVEQKIAEKKFAEAKKLIADFLSAHQSDNFYYHSKWNELVLSIARKEHDIPSIRKISFAFIENHFQSEYYRIYKSSFNTEEWEKELQNVINHYEKKKGKYFSDSIADVFAEEKDALRLIKYIEKYLSVERMEQYYSYFAKTYPKETLDLFQKAINQYAEKNTGRNYYEHIAELFKKIYRIEGGREMAATMVVQYKSQYKNRRAMVEILNKIKF
ncbi:MAG: SWIM zinc finger family protein [Bacteroidia bacterium]|nr:SWIM zinc finger family protein [Bacteroidia bacterium]